MEISQNYNAQIQKLIAEKTAEYTKKGFKVIFDNGVSKFLSKPIMTDPNAGSVAVWRKSLSPNPKYSNFEFLRDVASYSTNDEAREKLVVESGEYFETTLDSKKLLPEEVEIIKNTNIYKRFVENNQPGAQE